MIKSYRIFKRDNIFFKTIFVFNFILISLSFFSIGENTASYFQDSDISIVTKIITIIMYLGSMFFLFTKIELYADKVRDGFIEIKYTNIFSVQFFGVHIFKGVLFTLNSGRGYIVFHCMMKRPEEFVYSLYMALKKANNNIVMSDVFVATARSYANKNKFEFGE